MQLVCTCFKLDQNKFFSKSESERYILVCLHKSEKKGILDALLLKHGHLIL